MEDTIAEPSFRPPKWLRWWHVALMLAVGLFVIAAITYEVLKPPNKAAEMSSSSKVSVTSSTRDNADIDVNHDGSWSETTNQRLPWSEALGPGIVSIAAQNNGSNGSITCTITNSDGVVRDTETSNRPYGEVACNTNRGNSGTSGSAGNSGTSGKS